MIMNNIHTYEMKRADCQEKYGLKNSFIYIHLDDIHILSHFLQLLVVIKSSAYINNYHSFLVICDCSSVLKMSKRF